MESCDRDFGFLSDVNLVDPSGGGPLAAGSDQFLEHHGLAQRQKLDRAVQPVAHPTVESEAARRILDEMSITDALDLARDDDPDRLHARPPRLFAGLDVSITLLTI